MTASQPKRFTVEEANRALPLLARRLERLEQTISVLESMAPVAPPDRHRFGAEGGMLVPRVYLDGVEEIVEEGRRLEESGIVVRDLRKGLIDFPALLEGREVFLCWLKGEERIGFFHEADAGFASRKPLPPDLT